MSSGYSIEQLVGICCVKLDYVIKKRTPAMSDREAVEAALARPVHSRRNPLPAGRTVPSVEYPPTDFLAHEKLFPGGGKPDHETLRMHLFREGM